MSALTSNFSSWSTTLSANPESLTLPLSSTNVEHVLKTAVTRTPQKILLAAILPHIVVCLQNNVAASILTSLVRYATPKSVGQISAAVLQHWSDVQNNLSSSAETASLLEAIVSRSDDNSAPRQDLIKKLCTLPISELLANPKFLVVAAALVVVEPAFAAKMLKSKEALKVFSGLLTGETKSKEGIRFVEQTLASVEDKPAMCRWVMQAMKASDAKARHRSEVVAAVAVNADKETIEVLARNMISWPIVAVNGVMAKALVTLLSSCTEATGSALAKKVLETISVASIVSDKGTSLAALGVVLGERYASLMTPEEAARLVASKVRIEAATKPKNLSTRDIILEKIRLFEASRKRPRSS